MILVIITCCSTDVVAKFMLLQCLKIKLCYCCLTTIFPLASLTAILLDEDLYGSKEDEPTGGKDDEDLGSVRRRSRAVARRRIWVVAGRRRRNQAAVMARSSWMTVLRRKRIQTTAEEGGWAMWGGGGGLWCQEGIWVGKHWGGWGARRLQWWEV